MTLARPWHDPGTPAYRTRCGSQSAADPPLLRCEASGHGGGESVDALRPDAVELLPFDADLPVSGGAEVAGEHGLGADPVAAFFVGAPVLVDGEQVVEEDGLRFGVED